ncbi:hypothetical protein DXG01_010090 [Tephrocybe rancida]|nr:hypothetical protein DXG01_010090 [Tephrocybe rancida]
MPRRKRLICLVPVLLVLLCFLLPKRRNAIIKATVDRILDQAILELALVQDLDYGLQRFFIPCSRYVPCPVYNTSLATDNLCHSLAGKIFLFVGPETTYHLHSLWLDALSAHDNREITCTSPSSCFHHVCRGTIPRNTGRGVKFPHQDELLATNSSLIRYVRSHSLYASDDPKDTAYTEPTVDAFTGVRVWNTYWLRHARQADVIVLNHGPLPAPVSTYDDGNWVFPDQPVYNADSPVVNAALHATLTRFIPSTVRALEALDGLKKRPLVVWHGSWLMDLGCSDRKQRVMQDPLNVPLATDPWTLYYNVQGKSMSR